MPSSVANFIVRPLAPLVSAVRGLQQTLYLPPRTTIAGISDDLWPNPLQPVTPIQPARAEPLGWPMNWGRNILYTPREDAEYSAAELRRLSSYPLARICIENNKDILTRMPRKVQLKPLPGENAKERANRGKGDELLLKLNKFFDRPNWNQDWSEFLRPLLDDMLVIDAPAIFLGRARGSGDVVELRYVDGASITRLVDEHGWTPPPPNPAYHQLWQGYPRIDLTTDQLVYRPRNIVPRNTQSSYLYGMSPTEQIAKEIEIGWQRLQFVYDFYSEGSIPGGILFAPVGTSPDKIKEAQQFIDSDLAGNLAKKRRLQIFQGFQDQGHNEQLTFPKEPAMADLFDEVHTRKICFAYGTSPQRLMRSINRSSAQTMQESAEEEGTLPWLNWLKGTMDYVIQVAMKQPDYEFAFDPFIELDKLKQAMADAEDIKIGLYSRNEKREERGDEPVDTTEADELNVLTGQGLIPLNYSATMKLNASKAPVGTSRAPSGGKQPKASTQLASTASSKTSKVNGVSFWNTCEKHKDSYPRETCTDCIVSEKVYQKIQEHLEELDDNNNG